MKSRVGVMEPPSKSLQSPESASIVTPTRKEFGRLASKRFISSVFGSPNSTEWADAQNLVRNARRDKLRRPLELSNGDVFGLTLRMMSEMEFTTLSTAVAFYSKCFSGKALVNWAMEQEFRDQTFRDEADALFLGNELLIRGIIQPVARDKNPTAGNFKTLMATAIPGAGLGKAWKTFWGGEWTYRIKVRTRAELIAACFVNSTQEEKDHIRECVGKMKTLRALIDGNLSDSDSDDEGEQEARAFVKMEELTTAMKKAFTWNGYLGMPYRAFASFLESIEDSITEFFSTLGPHVLVAFTSLLFTVWIQNFVLACVFALTFMRHIMWVDEQQREKLADAVRSDQLRKFQRVRGDPSVNRHGVETCDWWSSIWDHMWHGWAEGWMNRLVRAQLEWLFETTDFAFISKIELSEFKFGSAGPCFKHARTYTGVDGEMVVEKDLDWQTQDFSMLISALFGKPGVAVPIPIRLRLTDVRIEGNLRLIFTWMRTTGGPYVRSLRVSFIGLPKYSFAIKALGAVNLAEISIIDGAVRKVLDEYFRTSLCEPEGYFWDVKAWWNESSDAEQVIDPAELITPVLMKDIERIWRRQPRSASVEIRVMPNFVELDSSGKNLLLKKKYLDGERCRMYITVGHGRRRVVTKAHHMVKHVEAEDENCPMPTWDSAGFSRLDSTEETIDGQLSFILLSESIDANAAKATASKLFRISRKVVAVAKIDDLTTFKGGDVHNIELTLLGARSMRPVGVLHLRLRVNVLNQNLKVDNNATGGALGSLKQQVQRLNTTIGASTGKAFDVSRKGATMCFGCLPKLTHKFRPKSAASMGNESDDDDFGVELRPLPAHIGDNGAIDDFGALEQEIIVPGDEFYANLDAKILLQDSPPLSPTSSSYRKI